MRDIFVCPHGNMLDNWKQAYPKALVTVSVITVPVSEPVVFWVHANLNDGQWLKNAMAQINSKFQASKVVVLANTPSQADALAAMTQGASAYCHAYSDPKVLQEVKTVVMHGGVWLGNDLLQTIIGATKPLVKNASEHAARALNLLTDREKQTALEAAKGLSNKEIARVLNITERTVKAHISKVYEKLGVKDRLQLALMLNDNPNPIRQAPVKKATAHVKPFKTKKTAYKGSQGTTKDKKKLEHVA